ncbi:ShlB/FhaC/HecB family hemolysin secretion/activation protein [Derxia gummosa]|uniref:ShlB/FhaC/HecB family hemolysin secretion/activation protein n=1 Tax=Derxia gummosa DSM 723 TaxID=1121388 RepID=A0A8B6X7W6_9BURK|nr:ShlB/FhaC/HecB family hemolysin secretion/activation protein [Derxia gummosa]
MKSPASLAFCIAAGLSGLPLAALAQTPPQAGDLLRELDRQPQRDAPATLPPPVAPAGPAAPAAGPRVDVTAFRIEGATLVPEAELQDAVAPWAGKPASFADLRRAADAIAARYQARGLLARTLLPEQDLAGGVVVVRVIEARLGAVRIDRPDGATRMSDDTATGYLTARQSVGDPVRPDDLQRGISLLNDLPGTSATSLLEPGAAEGESRVVVALRDKPVFTGLASVDNAGAKASGTARGSVGLQVNSPFGLGEQLQLLGNKSSGTDYGRVQLGMPLGKDGLRASVNASRLNYGYTLSGNRYTGSASVLGASLGYPLLRSAGSNLTLQLDHDRKRFDNEVQAIAISNKDVRLTTLALYGDRLDEFMGGGMTQFSVSIASGTLDLGRNPGDLAADQFPGGPDRNGSFTRTNWSLTRLQRLTAADTLALIASGQIASRNLDASERLTVTGPYAVRAYTSSEPAADDGTLASIELRHQFADQLTATVFHDRAQARRDHEVNSATARPNAYRLAATGLGLALGKPGDLLLRATVAWRNGDNPTRNPATGLDADGTRRNPRLFLTLTKNF